MKRSVQAWLGFVVTRLGGIAVDGLSLALAYVAANLLRFDLQPPRWGWRVTACAFVSVGIVHLAALVVCGCYRLSWRRTTLRDLPRYLTATALACGVLTALRICFDVEVYAHVRPPYSVTLICFILATCALAGWRIVWSWFWAARQREETLIAR